MGKILFGSVGGFTGALACYFKQYNRTITVSVILAGAVIGVLLKTLIEIINNPKKKVSKQEINNLPVINKTSNPEEQVSEEEINNLPKAERDFVNRLIDYLPPLENEFNRSFATEYTKNSHENNAYKLHRDANYVNFIENNECLDYFNANKEKFLSYDQNHPGATVQEKIYTELSNIAEVMPNYNSLKTAFESNMRQDEIISSGASTSPEFLDIYNIISGYLLEKTFENNTNHDTYKKLFLRLMFKLAKIIEGNSNSFTKYYELRNITDIIKIINDKIENKQKINIAPLLYMPLTNPQLIKFITKLATNNHGEYIILSEMTPMGTKLIKKHVKRFFKQANEKNNDDMKVITFIESIIQKGDKKSDLLKIFKDKEKIWKQENKYFKENKASDDIV